MLPILNYFLFYVLIATSPIYLLSVQQACNEEDFIIPGGHYVLIMPSKHYNLIMPAGYYRRTLSRFNVHKIRHYFGIVRFITNQHNRYRLTPLHYLQKVEIKKHEKEQYNIEGEKREKRSSKLYIYCIYLYYIFVFVDLNKLYI